MERDEFIVLDYLDAFKLADESFIEEDTGIEKSLLKSRYIALVDRKYLGELFEELLRLGMDHVQLL